MADPVVTVRPGTLADVPAFRALGEAVVPPTYGPIDAAYARRMLDEWWVPEVFETSLARNPHLVAEVDGEVVALANLGRLSQSYRDFPHVTGDREVMWKLYVHPDHHGRGIGSRLLAEVEAMVEGDELWLEVVDGNEQAFDVLPRARLRGGRAGHRPRVARRRLDAQAAGDEAAMSRFRKYDGGDPLAPPVDLAEALDAIGQDVMAGYSPERAMREFLRRGGTDQAGLDELARRVAERRREILERNDLDGTMREVKRAPRQGRAGRARAAGPRHHAGRRRPRVPGAHARQPAVLHPGRGGRAVVVRLEVLGGARGLRGDQGPARPRAPRPALRRHEGGARGRHRGGPAGRPGDALRPQRPAGEARRRRRHGRGVPSTSWTSTATSSPTTRRTWTSCSTRSPSAPPPPSGCSTR